MILVDSREKKWHHIESYFKDKGIAYDFPHKLDVGDYASDKNPFLVVDRKANLQEVCSNLSAGADNLIRFTKELDRAKKQGIRLVVLIEGTTFSDLKDVAKWNSRYTKHTGKWMLEKMFKLTLSYGVEWRLCRNRDTARTILEILEDEVNVN